MIKLEIQASSPDALRDSVAALNLVMQSGLVRPTDSVSFTAVETLSEPALSDPLGGSASLAMRESQAPSDILQEPEPESAESTALALVPSSEPKAEAAPVVEPAPKKRTRKPKLVVPVEDVEPPADADDEDAAAEMAVDPLEEKTQAAAAVSEQELRDQVQRIMDRFGVRNAIDRLAKVSGHRRVKDIPPADYSRVHAALAQEA